MDCQEARDLIVESLTGTTPPDVRRSLAAHLTACAACRVVAAEVEQAVHLLRAAPEPRIPEGYWAAFTAALDARVAREKAGWRRWFGWARSPRLAWSTAAAASVLVVALGLARLTQPAGVDRGRVDDPTAGLSGLMTEAVVQTMPAMSAALESWKAGFSAADVSYEMSGGGE